MFNIINNNDLYKFLEYKFLDYSVTNKTKKLINDIVRFLDDEKYIPIYIEYINLTTFDYEILESVFDTLIYFKNKNKQYFIENKISDDLIEKLVYSQFYDINLLYQLSESKESNRLIKEFYDNKVEDNSRILMKIMYFFNESLFSKNLQLTIFEKNIYKSKVIEIFEESLNIDFKNKIIPIIDNISLLEKNNAGLKLYNKLNTVTLDSIYSKSNINQDPWYYFIALLK